MPKLKSKKGLAKRFKISKTGKIKRQKACRGHLLAKKPSKRKRLLRKSGLIAAVDAKTIKMLLPYR